MAAIPLLVSRILGLTAVSGMLLGCASGTAEWVRGDEKVPENLPPFDASVPGDAGTDHQVTCALNAPHAFNNHFSPHFGGDGTVDVEVVHFSSLY